MQAQDNTQIDSQATLSAVDADIQEQTQINTSTNISSIDALRQENVRLLNNDNNSDDQTMNNYAYDIQQQKKQTFNKTYSNESIESSYGFDNDESKKKMMHGFDERIDQEDMVCKRLSKENKYVYFEDYEKISDINAYQVMFQAHKASKFGRRVQRQMSSKVQKMNYESFTPEDFQDEEIDLFDGRAGKLSFYTMIVHGKIRERPDIEVKPWHVTLKNLSKLVFLPKEEIENVFIRHISFNGQNKSIWIDRTKVIEQLRDTDINHTKRKFTHITSKVIIPKIMFDEDYTEESEMLRRQQMEDDEDFDDEEEKGLFDYKDFTKSQLQVLQETELRQKITEDAYTIDITIEYPKSVLEVDDNGVKKTYTKYLNSEDMILIIKDKFFSWRDLLSDIFEKKLEEGAFIQIPGQENHFNVLRDEESIGSKDPLEIQERQNTMTHSVATKIFLTPSRYIFLLFENFKFNLRWDFDDPILFSYKCKFADPSSALNVMSKLKAMKVDILKLFAEKSSLFYYDPSSLWSMSFDFKKELETLSPDCDSEFFLNQNGRKTQRDNIRIKNRQNWLILEMIQPTLTVYKNFESGISFDAFDDKAELSPKTCSDEQKLQFKVKTSILEEFALSNLEGWELRVLKFLKIDLSRLNFPKAPKV
eukprot:403346684